MTATPDPESDTMPKPAPPSRLAENALVWPYNKRADLWSIHSLNLDKLGGLASILSVFIQPIGAIDVTLARAVDVVERGVVALEMIAAVLKRCESPGGGGYLEVMVTEREC